MVIGLLTTILFVTIELGLALDARLCVWTAAREGARRAAIEGGDTQGAREVVARQLALSPLLSDGHQVQISPVTASYGTPVSVVVTAEYRWRTPVGRLTFGESLIIRGEAQSRSEKVRTGS